MKNNYSKYYNIKIPSENLTLSNGIWYPKKPAKISRPKNGYNKLIEIEENSFWFQHRNKAIIETLRIFPPSGIIYDIGGGNGFVSLALQKKKLKTVLVEPEKEGAFNAKKRGIKNIICSKLEEIGFEKNSLPVVGLFDVIEHIKEDQKSLTYIFSLIEKGGRLYLTAPAYNFLWSYQDKNSGHFRRYTNKKLNKLLENSGFDIIYKTYFFSILPILIILFRTLRSKFKIKQNQEEMEKVKREHLNSKGLIGRILKIIWKFELRIMKSKKRILFGGSALIVAQKT